MQDALAPSYGVAISLTVKQRGVLKGIVAGLAITVVVIVGAILIGPQVLAPKAAVADRITFALRGDAFIALWLAVSIGLLAKHRFFTPEDLDGGGLTQGTDTANILQATLQNTLEQTDVALTFYPPVLMLVLAAGAAVIGCRG